MSENANHAVIERLYGWINDRKIEIMDDAVALRSSLAPYPSASPYLLSIIQPAVRRSARA